MQNILIRLPTLLATVAGPAPAEAVGGIRPELWHWLAFGAFVLVMLVLDLAVFHRQSHEPTLRESAFWTTFWCCLALSFNGLIWYRAGSKPAIEFLNGYLVEWSLSMDNVFVFAVIFGYFRVPLKYQYRVLFWGILGAIVMRLAFILLGTALIKRFEVVLLFFGVLLIYSGIKLMTKKDEVHPERNWLMRWGKRVFNVASGNHGKKFFVRENGKRCVTPLFLVLLVIESTDVLFAVDSVPAIFGLTKDPFIVFTSNIFAILGLRALYFLLAGVMDLFRYLSYGLAAVLIFVGLKMIAEYIMPVAGIEFHFFKDYPWASLVVIVSLLGISIAASLMAQRRETRAADDSA
ncbi:MAG: TerC family protein [Pirellulales bacterium]|nr:TerC family protein [Pirellulales bacterium]